MVGQSLLIIGGKTDEIVGCIGIEFVSPLKCEIRHIAVNPNSRNQQIGSNMIYFIMEQFQLDSIFAETDKDAVDFYTSTGFTNTSLGEKYLGVERFHCEFNTKTTTLKNNPIRIGEII